LAECDSAHLIVMLSERIVITSARSMRNLM
jgi:hypothetical protein